MIKRTIYIDAPNLYGGLAEILSPGDYIDFNSIWPAISEAFGGIDQIKAYGAYMGLTGNDDPVQLLFARAQNEFFNSIKSTPNATFIKGNISRHGKEKGVDMRLGVDMVHDAHQNLFDEAIIFSGDADFYYPIKIVQELGKPVHLCAFATRFTIPMSFKTKQKVLLDMNDYFASKIEHTIKRRPNNLTVIDITKIAEKKNA